MLLQEEKRREKEVEQMRASLDQMRAANQERQQKLQSAEATLTALQVIYFHTGLCPTCTICMRHQHPVGTLSYF